MRNVGRSWLAFTPPSVSPNAGSQFPHGSEVLLWQARLRILIASTAAVAEFVLLVSQGASRSPVVPFVLGATVAYLLFAALCTMLPSRVTVPPAWLLAAQACADVGLVFGITIAFSAPQYYGRALIFAFFVLHLTSFYLGRMPALWGFAATLIAYPDRKSVV